MAKAFSPDWLSHPGETILDAMKQRQISREELGQALGEPGDSVEALLSGRRAITIALARGLNQVLGASVEFWMNRDFQYREDATRLHAAAGAEWLSNLPVSEMVRLGWLSPRPRAEEELQACLDFFDVPDIPTWHLRYDTLQNEIAFRTTSTLDSRPGPVTAWLRRGAIEAEKMNCAPWDREGFRSALSGARRLTKDKDPQRFIPRLQHLCALHGVALVTSKTPAGCRASGATQFLASGRAMILLSSRYLSDDQFWFTFFHEAAHLILHADQDLFLEGLEERRDRLEQEANDFAANVIVPPQHLPFLLTLRASDPLGVVRFATQIGVAPGLVVGQLQHKGLVRQNQLNSLKRRYVWTDAGLVSRERV